MPKKGGKGKKKGKKTKEVTFGPNFAEYGINAVKCSLSKFMKVEKNDILVNVRDYTVSLRADEVEENEDESQ